MELVNEIYRLKDGLYGDPDGDASVRFATATAASLIFLFAPHLGAEVYERLTGKIAIESLSPSALLFSRGFRATRLHRALGRGVSVCV